VLDKAAVFFQYRQLKDRIVDSLFRNNCQFGFEQDKNRKSALDFA